MFDLFNFFAGMSIPRGDSHSDKDHFEMIKFLFVVVAVMVFIGFTCWAIVEIFFN